MKLLHTYGCIWSAVKCFKKKKVDTRSAQLFLSEGATLATGEAEKIKVGEKGNL